MQTEQTRDANYYVSALRAIRADLTSAGDAMSQAWKTYLPLRCDPVKMGREIETATANGLTLPQLRVRQREALITFDSSYYRFLTIVLDMSQMWDRLRNLLVESMKHWKQLDNRSPDRWLKDALAAEIVAGGKMFHITGLRRPDLHEDRPLRGMEEAAAKATLVAFDALAAELEAAGHCGTHNCMLGHSVHNTYPTTDACPAVLGGFEEGKYSDLRKVFLVPPRHLQPDTNPALTGLGAHCTRLDELLVAVRKMEAACSSARGSVNEGPHGLRLVQALQAGEVEDANAEAMVLQKPRRLNYEIARADLLVAIGEAEDYRRLVREQLVAAVKETKALLENHHRHINGSFDGELAARRAVHICLYVDHALRTAGKQLAHALSVYQLDITSRWASESVVAELNELAKQMRVEF